MNIYENKLYLEDLNIASNVKLPFSRLKDKKILITGARGLIGSFLVDVLMKKNIEENLNLQIIVLGRSKEKILERFSKYQDREDFKILIYDINSNAEIEYNEKIDFILHLASNTHPVAYATDPIGTIKSNVIGLDKLLDFATKNETERFLFASSNEIYGENRGDTELFDEKYCGYIDSNTLRAGYPESKRCGEALCQSYIQQKNLDCVIARFTRSYGPTMLKTDSKAISQFIKNGIDKENIILKSEGNQYYSYTYMADAAVGCLFVLLLGKTGDAYNIADINSDIRLKDLARKISDIAGTNVKFELPNELEAKGFSKATVARLDSSKLQSIGWKANYNIDSGLERTIKILENF